MGHFIFGYFFSIFKNPPLLNGDIFPELKIKYLKGKSSEVNFIDYYYRKFHYGDDTINNKYNDFCESLQRLKNNSEQDIETFFYILRDLFLNEDFVIITLPSHNPYNTNTGIKSLAQLIIKHNNLIIDGTDYLTRIKTTGNTFYAAEAIIGKENPKYIERLSIAKTYYENK